jgi:hypothetical protein
MRYMALVVKLRICGVWTLISGVGGGFQSLVPTETTNTKTTSPFICFMEDIDRKIQNCG